MEPTFYPLQFPIEHAITERIVKDLDHILAQGWADKIGAEDLGHAHVCVFENTLGGRLTKYGFKRGNLVHFYESEQQLRDLIRDDLDSLPITLLYHTHELDGKESDPNRNIKSIHGKSPEVIPAIYSSSWDSQQMDISAMLKRRESKAVTVFSRDIGLTDLFDLHFELNPSGKYRLMNGNRIDIFAQGLVKPKPEGPLNYNLQI